MSCSSRCTAPHQIDHTHIMPTPLTHSITPLFMALQTILFQHKEPFKMAVTQPLPEHASKSPAKYLHQHHGQDTDLRTSVIIAVVAVIAIISSDHMGRHLHQSWPQHAVQQRTSQKTVPHRSTSLHLTQISLLTPITDHPTRRHLHEEQSRVHDP